MNVLALTGSGVVHVGLAAMIFAMSMPSESILDLFQDCIFPSEVWSCADVRVQHGKFDHRPTTVFLHVPALDSASEIIPSPTGKGATR